MKFIWSRFIGYQLVAVGVHFGDPLAAALQHPLALCVDHAGKNSRAIFNPAHAAVFIALAHIPHMTERMIRMNMLDLAHLGHFDQQMLRELRTPG